MSTNTPSHERRMSSQSRRAWRGAWGIEAAARRLAALIVAALLLSAAPARGQTALTEVKNADETIVLRIHEDGSLISLGEFETGTIPAEGVGTRLMWHPAKAAFRAGAVGIGFPIDSDGTEWDETNVGDYSVAFGGNTTASGSRATAMGWRTTASSFAATALGSETEASSNFATALGRNTTASGTNATAMGWSTTASGTNATAMGRQTTASGTAATAMGEGTTAGGDYSTAMGNDSEASMGYATAMGEGATASGEFSTAMGGFTTASGNGATAMGNETTASGVYATAMGNETTAQAYASLVIGRYNAIAGSETSWEADDPLFVAGNGSGDTDRSNALTLLKNGDLTIAGTLTESSDRRLKTEVQPLGPALAKLNGLEPVTFRFKDGTGHPAGRQLGLVAQEVEQAFPALVSRGTDGYLSVAYPKLTAVLLKGLQEQQTQIEEQEAQIKQQQNALAQKTRALEAVQDELDAVQAKLERAHRDREALTDRLARLEAAVRALNSSDATPSSSATASQQ